MRFGEVSLPRRIDRVCSDTTDTPRTRKREICGEHNRKRSISLTKQMHRTKRKQVYQTEEYQIQ